MTDIEIAHNTEMLPIKDIATRVGIEDYLEYYGSYKAKVKYDEVTGEKGKLILVTATSPTPFGDGLF